MKDMQPTEQPEHPIDYLNSIASVPEKSGKQGNVLFFAALIAAVLVAGIVAMLAVVGAGPNSKENLSQISLQLKDLQSVTDGAQKNITSSRLRATNTSLSLTLTGANRDVAELLTAEGLDAEKVQPTSTDAENTEALSKKLEDARLNAIFDRTYAREMSYKLATTLVLIEQLESKTKQGALKDYLTTTHTNLEPLQKQYANFDDTLSKDSV